MADGFELTITVDLAEALDTVLGAQLSTRVPIVLLSRYIDSLAKGFGLSESANEDPLVRTRSDLGGLPEPAIGLIRHFLPESGDANADGLRGRLYSVLVELDSDPSAGRHVNDVLRLGQIYWCIEGSTERPRLPIRANQQIHVRGRTTPAAIRVPGANADFATMPWAKRINVKGAHSSSSGAMRKQGARLAVLAAKHIIDRNPVAPPDLGNAVLECSRNEAGKPRISIVWPRGEAGSIVTSRARAYFAIDSFEQDLRQSIERFLLERGTPKDVFGAEHDRLCARQAQDDVSVAGALTQYLHGQQAYDVLLRHTVALTAGLADLLQLNLGAFDGFIPVRNRVMHGRPLQPGDLDATELFIRRFRSPHFPQTELALTQLALDDGWQPRQRFGSALPERILHNLPSPDFDETGLYGREREVQDIVGMVKRQRNRMITLIGEGGIGKTALALEVCYRLADDPEPPFEAILWTSLKNERLTPAGIQELSNVIRDIDGATSALGEAMDRTFQGGAGELAESLGEMSTLIVLDNLETAHGNEVLSLSDALPDSVTFLCTSRKGVGQLERHFKVGPLEQQSAELLFRKFAGSRGQSDLAELPSPTVGDRIRQLRHSPLAIRWYILSVEAGKTPTDTLRNQDDLLRFCIENVVADLSGGERLLLEVLQALDRPVPLEELAVISEMDIDTLRRGTQRLTQRSLIVWSSSAGADETEVLALSSTARAYLRTVAEPEMSEDVIRRESAYNQERELQRERIAEHGRYLDPNVIYERSDSDAPTAHLLQRALRESKAGHPEFASATMAQARALDPGYFEVDRVDAYLAGVRNATDRATRLYRSALSNCSTEEQLCWVRYFFAGLLAGQGRDIRTAIRFAEDAHEWFDSYDTALQLGNFYVRDARFEEGEPLIESALKRAPGKPRFERIATTALVDCFRRWSQADLAAGHPASALDRALRGMDRGFKLHDSASTDEQLMRSILRAAVAALTAVRPLPELGPEEERDLANALQRLCGDPRFSLLPPWRQLESAVSSLSIEMRSQLAPDFVTTERVRGHVARLHEKFGFIAHPDFPNDVFFHAGSLRAPARMHDLKVGLVVELTVSKNDKGQDQALDVCLAELDANPASAVDQ